MKKSLDKIRKVNQKIQNWILKFFSKYENFS